MTVRTGDTLHPAVFRLTQVDMADVRTETVTEFRLNILI